MGKKMLGTNAWVEDAESTAQAVRERILESRRERDIEKDDARREWDLADELRTGSLDFRAWYEQTSLCDCDVRQTKLADCWTHFWERLWAPFIQPQLLKGGAK
jgi:hypothetical protein